MLNLEQLETKWKNNSDPIDTGRKIFESVPSNDVPLWASNILRVCYGRHKKSVVEIDCILNVAETQSEWHTAHDVFSEIRSLTIKEQKKVVRENELLLSLLYVAEIVAKVTFNSTNTTIPFDAHSGWRIPENARDYAALIKDDAFLDLLWQNISRYMQNND